ncbi:MAG: hypothetical protein Q4A60_09150 [Pasteurellaceae bacterium]|nr:hypothetical protein [Pasteurellaceae bacterium]
MKFIQMLSITSVILISTACSNDFHINQLEELFTPTTQGKPVKVVYDAPNRYENQKPVVAKTAHKTTTTVTNKRINTTQCTDLDDWYLDGYRVGRSFSAQKAQMLQQRMSYCQLTQLPTHFKNNWERGYTIGYREATPSRKRK